LVDVKTLMRAAGAGLLVIGGAAIAAPSALKGDAGHGQQLFARCAACHTAGLTGGKMGPSLNGVVGRKAGSVAGYVYSAPMKNSGLTWDPATLARFLQAPMKVVPGTKMFFPGLPNPQDQADLTAYLKQYRADGSKK
jgi:cytochrome c